MCAFLWFVHSYDLCITVMVQKLHISKSVFQWTHWSSLCQQDFTSTLWVLFFFFPAFKSTRCLPEPRTKHSTAPEQHGVLLYLPAAAAVLPPDPPLLTAPSTHTRTRTHTHLNPLKENVWWGVGVFHPAPPPGNEPHPPHNTHPPPRLRRAPGRRNKEWPKRRT